MASAAKFSIGIEEEYLLVDPETRALANRQPPEFMARCKERLGGSQHTKFNLPHTKSPPLPVLTP